MRKKYLISCLVALFVFSILVVSSFMNGYALPGVAQVAAANTIDYDGKVFVSTTGEFEGRKTPAGEGINELLSVIPFDNLLFEEGAEAIESYLGAGTGGGDAFDWISLCDATNTTCNNVSANNPDTTWSAWAECGLEYAQAAYDDLGNGNWSVYKVFTSTCSNVQTNITHLQNAGEGNLSGVEFTHVTLQENDQLTINWTVTAS